MAGFKLRITGLLKVRGLLKVDRVNGHVTRGIVNDVDEINLLDGDNSIKIQLSKRSQLYS